MPHNDEYRSYLLRLWRTREDDQDWRAQLEEVETGKRIGFASLEKLIEFLQGLDHEDGAGKEVGDLKN
jgi:hypothetical protein